MVESIRRATKGDYNDIISIIPSGEYFGDYLPDFLYSLIDNPLYRSFVYMLDGKIVGTTSIFLIDDGETGAMRNGRVRKEYQGKGVLRKVGYEALKQYPNLKYTVSATSVNLSKVYQQRYSKLIAVRERMFYTGKKQNVPMNLLMNDRQTTDVHILSEPDLRILMKEKKLYPNICKDERLLVFFTPYRIIEPNVALIFGEGTRVAASFLGKKDPSLLTFGTYFRQPNGEMFCIIDIYGTIGHNLLNHVLFHIQNCFKLITDSFIIEIRYSEHSVIISEVLRELGLIDYSTETPQQTNIVVTEQVHVPETKL